MSVADTASMHRAKIIGPGATVAELVEAYNWATDPTRAMNDRDHRRCEKIARMARQRLAGRTGWHETESGVLVASGASRRLKLYERRAQPGA